MSYADGLKLGAIFAVVLSSSITFAMWFRARKFENIEHMIGFTTISFIASLALGFLGGIPAILLSRWYLKNKMKPLEDSANIMPTLQATFKGLDNLERLNELKDKKIISEEEFESAKKKILAA